MSGIYIHIPFCKQACSYCDFYFLTRSELRKPFVEALFREIRGYKGDPMTEEPVETIYLGGGTPSLLDPGQLHSIFEALHDVFRIEPKEITMEMNPDDVNSDYLKSIRELGVNRASMGVQSFDEDLLRFMHRAHTPEEAVRALEAIEKAGFPTFTADLIYGNPGQSVKTLKRDIRQLLSFTPPHISAYSLTVEPKTRLGKQVELGLIKPPDDEMVAEHFDITRTELKKAGLNQYEVSNYAVPGKEALHNSNYWNHINYIGFGPSAHSFWWDDDRAIRWRNLPDIRKYLDPYSGNFRESEEELSKRELAEERIMLGLRTREGISLQNLEKRYDYRFDPKQKEWIELQERRGALTLDNSTLKLTGDGIKISDLLVVDLLSRSGSTREQTI